ncbi:MAG: helix-turn-helix transcriptional regulator [Granulosicoccus sp.]|nr:helix-turn-helix transcriptional regulator [Granulosicoccus sp.]
MSLSQPASTLGTREYSSDPAFLTVPELARLLHVNEKKIYQLAGCGEIPGTKITGKWIFPRRLIEDWLLENSHGGVMHDRLLIAGSDDRLVHQTCEQVAIEWQQNALISYSPSGTRHGLRMLDMGKVDACFINWGAIEENARRHLGLLRRYRNHQSWVIVRCLQRSQGLVIHPEHCPATGGQDPEHLNQILSNSDLRWAMRQEESGSYRLLADLCASLQKPINELQISTQSHSERSAVSAVNSAQADITCAVQSSATEFQLAYQPVATVALDLVMTRKSYFRTLMQEFIEKLRDGEACAKATSLGGYQISPHTQLITVTQ